MVTYHSRLVNEQIDVYAQNIINKNITKGLYYHIVNDSLKYISEKNKDKQ